MKLLITGGSGFIGSNLILYWANRYPNDQICNLDKLTYAANPEYLTPVHNNPNYSFCQVDLADRKRVKHIVHDFRPDGVIHLAAESHVDNSIKDPEAFVTTNVLGTFNLLEECRQLWSQYTEQFKHKRFYQISTDEVYGMLGDEGYFSEQSPYTPSSPYSATKAGSDHLVRSYHHTYGMNTVISNCSNNYGPHQHLEKLIPTVIRTALRGKPIPVYGQGANVRDWLYVKDHCRAIELVFHQGISGETYNVGGHNEWKNLDLVQKICDILNNLIGQGPDGDYKNLITFVDDRPGHDFRYAIDPGKIERELGWKPEHDFETNLRDTILWYLSKLKPEGTLDLFGAIWGRS